VSHDQSWDEEQILWRLGRRLKERREAQGLSPYQIERQTGLSSRVIRRIEAGVDVQVSHWLQLVWALDWDWEELWAVLPPRPEFRRERPLNETAKRILAHLRARGGRLNCAVAQLAGWIGRSDRQVWRVLRSLEERGLIVKERSGRGQGQGNTCVLVEGREDQ
jgi:transcriptional regulator with XRE-family HTH domain